VANQLLQFTEKNVFSYLLNTILHYE